QACGRYAAKDLPLEGQTVTIFNRSEVVGRPLAAMLAHDGAQVISFDVDGPIVFKLGGCKETKISREEALQTSDIVITGVPSKSFPPIRARELKSSATCINFSTIRNFASEVPSKVHQF